MSRTLVVLLEHPPGIPGLTRALAAADPALRVRLAADGAIIHLRDEARTLVAAVHAAQRLAVSAEAERVLDTALPSSLPAQPWWVEARTTDAGLADPDLRQRKNDPLAQRARNLGLVVVGAGIGKRRLPRPNDRDRAPPIAYLGFA